MIDVIISGDGDLLVLGGDNIISDLHYRSGQCCYYQRAMILANPSMGAGRYNDYLPILSNFLGNDYIKRLHGNGPKKVRELMDDYITNPSQREQMILNLAATRKYNKEDERFATDYAEKFWPAINL